MSAQSCSCLKLAANGFRVRCAACGAGTRHWCGGTLTFERRADGQSYEHCDGCDWFYGFGEGQSASDVRAAINRQCPKAS